MTAFTETNSNDAPVSQTMQVHLTADPTTEHLLITVQPPNKPEGDGDVKLGRAPVDFVLTIDVSGSMGVQAPIPGENEATGLSILDVVKHAAKTIITTMRDDDRVAIVAFQSEAKIVVGLTPTNEAGKKKALDQLELLRPGSATNIWDGLKTSLNVLKDAKAFAADEGVSASTNTGEGSSSRGIGALFGSTLVKSLKTAKKSTPHRFSSIFLLTDGQPTVAPPRGHIPMLERYLETNEGADRITINTFGFGYDLDSHLLHSIARIGRGTFGFIPDSGMVGTVFVHAVANVYATWADRLEILVDGHSGYEDAVHEITDQVSGKLDVVPSAAGLHIHLNPLQYGQTRDVVLKLPPKFSDASLTITVRCRPWNSDENVTVSSAFYASTHPPSAPADLANVMYHVCRLKLVTDTYDILKTDSIPEQANHSYGRRMGTNRLADANAKEAFERLISGIQSAVPDASSSTPASNAHALMGDIQGQVLIAITDSNYNRWGEHYLLSLARAHQRQTCVNFKDVGVQVYGKDSEVFKAWRDEIDRMFDDLPPPKPSVAIAAVGAPQFVSPSFAPLSNRNRSRPAQGGASAAYGAAPPPPPQGEVLSARKGFSMASYNSRAAPCFAGACLIRLDDTKSIELDKLKTGMMVQTPKGSRKVRGIVRTAVQGGEMELCRVGETLLITPWHPIKPSGDGKWVFPSNVVEPGLETCDAVYSIVLEADNDPAAHGVYIGGVLCVTLGHGICKSTSFIRDARAHPFLGNYEAVLTALTEAPKLSGSGTTQAEGIQKDGQTGLMNGFIWKQGRGEVLRRRE